MSTDPKNCMEPHDPWGSCIQALAAGWILLGDLCPVCTHVLMRALDRSVPDLPWHQEYLDRAAVVEAVTQ